MRHRTSAFYSDELYLSRWDLIRLFFGKTFHVSGLIITGNPFFKQKGVKYE
jgi:hypothetical protein